MAALKAIEHLDQIAAGHPHSPASTRVQLTLGEVRDLNARITWLTDSLVAAAALWFGEIEDPSERDYASEELHEIALDLVRENPRLKGGFRGSV
jgi:hypothetical protein